MTTDRYFVEILERVPSVLDRLSPTLAPERTLVVLSATAWGRAQAGAVATRLNLYEHASASQRAQVSTLAACVEALQDNLATITSQRDRALQAAATAAAERDACRERLGELERLHAGRPASFEDTSGEAGPVCPGRS